LIVTHPHDDHIEDIAAVKTKLAPAILHRQRYDWQGIKAPDAEPDDYKNLDLYSQWQDTYCSPVKVEPNWGMQVETFYLTPDAAYKLDKSKYVNNSSIVTVVSFKGTKYSEKFVFAGDVEQAGWEAPLQREDFRNAVSDTDFYIASHQGHTSGFSTDLYKAMAKPFLNLVSVHSRDEHVDGRYSSSDYSRGVKFGDESRYMLSTRSDGSIFVDVDAEGRFVVATRDLPGNLAKAAIAG
jgi:beta-lactamase superfamily II metal-dependent hydrolase